MLNRGYKLLIVSWLLMVSVVCAYAEDERYRELELLTDVLTLIEHNYVDEVKARDLLRGAVNGMLATLDPHSSFLPPEMYREMKIDTKGEFGGLGIEISLRDDILTIIAPLEDTPADRAGLQAGDQIFKIEDSLTKGLGLDEAVNLMRGAPGTEITITIMRAGFAAPREFRLTREIIKIKSVKGKTLEDGFGYVRLAQFQERSSVELAAILEQLRLENAGEIKGLILDLRNNPGGLLDQAIAISDMFLDRGLIVYTEGRDESNKMQFTARQQGTEPNYPLVLLINGGSASAAEIVAGALQDHHRAVILGTRSFGKGSVQTIIPLGDQAALRLTTARYYTPSGTSIQARGITPDIEVAAVEVKELKDPEFVHERDLRQHIEAPVNGVDKDAQAPSSPTFQPVEAEKKDYQLMRALDLLKGWRIMNRLQRAS